MNVFHPSLTSLSQAARQTVSERSGPEASVVTIVIGDRLSIRAALKLIRDAAKAVQPIAHEVCPLEMDVPAEEVQEEEVRLADREIVLIEAETGFVAEIISLLRAAKRAGKDVKLQRLSALEGDVPLDPPFNEWLRRPVREAQPVRANKLPGLKKSSSI